MKKIYSPSQRRTAFTLVELLVVMGIIAVLAAVVIGGVGAAIRMAKRTKANATAVQIQTAVNSYYTEYGVYPVATVMTTDDYYDGAAGGGIKWANLTYALCGNINPYTGSTTAPGSPVPPNTRSIPYLAPTRSDLDTTNPTLKNPFGTSATTPYFYMVVDTDYSGVVGDTSATKLPDFTKYSTNYLGATLPLGTPGGVAVWSPCDQPLTGTGSKPSPASAWAHTY